MPAMRTRTITLAAVTAGLTLALGACSAETADPDPTTGDDAAVTSTAEDGLEGEAGNRGWMCQYVSPTAIELANGGEAQTPRELVTQDDADNWVCDVLVGGPGEQAPLIRLGIRLGEDARDTARARAEGEEGVEDGPEHLGVSFVSPGLVTGLTLCGDPQSTDAQARIPYSLVIESLGETDVETTDHLQRALTETAKSLDQSLGCSPKRAVEEDASATTAP
jgi:hypothetical protein